MASQTNYSMYSLPAYFALSIVPHMYAIVLLTSNNNGYWDNTCPRSADYNAKIQKSVPAACFTKYERAEAAHKNGMENLPLIATAVILGNMARLPVGKLNMVTGLYLGTRVVYNLVYITVEKHSLSLSRTLIWWSGVACDMYLIVSAGNVFSAGWP